MNASQILLREEFSAVLDDLSARAKHSKNSKLNLIIFRLAACCGLRRGEMCGLNMSDFTLNTPKPVIHIRKENTKGRDGKRRARFVPLDWDTGSLKDLTAWHALRVSQGAGPLDPFVATASGKRLEESLAFRRWRTAIRVLGPERVKQVSIHDGRHTFCSHALHGGKTLVQVRDAAGHSSVNTTNIYLHILDQSADGKLFDFSDLKTINF